ncbi:MAG: hypothetical protein JG766_82 [Desulfacinum sp.]|jgi:hypothetical protein|nr:hypothetical protein [Desulfacinum sp.]
MEVPWEWTLLLARKCERTESSRECTPVLPHKWECMKDPWEWTPVALARPSRTRGSLCGGCQANALPLPSPASGGPSVIARPMQPLVTPAQAGVHSVGQGLDPRSPFKPGTSFAGMTDSESGMRMGEARMRMGKAGIRIGEEGMREAAALVDIRATGARPAHGRSRPCGALQGASASAWKSLGNGHCYLRESASERKALGNAHLYSLTSGSVWRILGNGRRLPSLVLPPQAVVHRLLPGHCSPSSLPRKRESIAWGKGWIPAPRSRRAQVSRG